MTEGFLTGIDADAYHRDELGGGPPALSASIATVLLNSSPAHAKAQHPRLNPEFKREDDRKFDLGTAAHQVLLEGNVGHIAIVEAENWLRKDAKEAAAWARENGLTPLLRAQYENVEAMVKAAREQIAELRVDPLPFTDGEPEVTITWTEPNGVRCKSRLDWWNENAHVCDDLKSTKTSANPEQFSRHIYSMSYHVKAAFYVRGIEKLTGRKPEFRFVAVETSPPYGLSVHTLTPAGWALGERQVEHAIRLWGDCLALDDWPCYDRRLAYAEPPAWLDVQWLAREARESSDEQREAA